jgi:hypothetical protein
MDVVVWLRSLGLFAYLTMAGIKSLGVYSLDEAGAHFNAALAVLDSAFHSKKPSTGRMQRRLR